MKKYLILITLAALPFIGISQTTYDLNYDVIGIGKKTGGSTVNLRGIVKIPNATNGGSGDSVLVISNSRIYKVARTAFSNAATATALQNARTIWGQSFDGTANVTGAMTGVTNITVSANLLALTDATVNIGSSTNQLSNVYTTNIQSKSGTSFNLGTIGGNSINFKTSGTNAWQITGGSNQFIPLADNSYNIGSASFRINTGYFTNLQLGVTGLLKASGAGNNIVAAVPGTDYVVPSALNSYVPYTGASGSLNMGAYNITAAFIQANAGIDVRGNFGAYFWNAANTFSSQLVAPTLTANRLLTAPNESGTILTDATIKYGATTVVMNGTDVVFNIPHGLGSVPASFAVTFEDASNLNFVQSTRTVTSTNIVLTCSAPPIAGSQKVYWQVFK